MSITYSAAEIFDIGIDIEKNGRAFYQEAARLSHSKPVTDLLTELAEWEDAHIALFEELKERTLTPESREAWDPDGEAQAYLQAIAATHVFTQQNSSRDIAAQCQTPQEVLSTALQFEKDSVVCYVTMKNALPSGKESESISHIINEEIRHISILDDKLRQLIAKV